MTEDKLTAALKRVVDAGDRYAELLARRTGEDVEDVKAMVQGKIERIMRKFK